MAAASTHAIRKCSLLLSSHMLSCTGTLLRLGRTALRLCCRTRGTGCGLASSLSSRLGSLRPPKRIRRIALCVT